MTCYKIHTAQNRNEQQKRRTVSTAKKVNKVNKVNVTMEQVELNLYINKTRVEFPEV